MVKKDSETWRKQRMVGSVLVFGAAIFGLRYTGFAPKVAVGAALMLTLVHFLAISVFVKLAERGE